MLSDFYSDDYEEALKVVSKRHDIIGVKVYDDLESHIPDVGLIKVRDAESGEEKMVDTSSSEVRRLYRSNFQSHQDYFVSAFRKCGADTLVINTMEDYVKHLLKFFKSRHHK